jgi:hypothetical protein
MGWATPWAIFSQTHLVTLAWIRHVKHVSLLLLLLFFESIYIHIYSVIRRGHSGPAIPEREKYSFFVALV